MDQVTAFADFTAGTFGAEGFSANSTGGRDGRVIEVTNLNDNGPGTLRAAIEAEGLRIVVIRVAGTIELETSLEITKPYITIAGQTASGGAAIPDRVKASGESEMSVS